MKLVVIFCVMMVSVSVAYSLSCAPCDPIPVCDPAPVCPGSLVRPPCGCCLSECAKQEGEVCGGLWDFSGKCDVGMVCLKPESTYWSDEEGICKYGLKIGSIIPRKVFLPSFVSDDEIDAPVMDYAKAEDVCSGMGAKVAVIESEAELNALRDYVFSRIGDVADDSFHYSIFGDTVMWIGNVYKNGISTPSYTKWADAKVDLPYDEEDHTLITVTFSYHFETAGMENRKPTYHANGVVCQRSA